MTKLEGAAFIQGAGVGASTGAVMTLSIHQVYVVYVALVVICAGYVFENHARNTNQNKDD